MSINCVHMLLDLIFEHITNVSGFLNVSIISQFKIPSCEKMQLLLALFALFIYTKGLGSRRGEIGPAIEMHTDLKYAYMVYFIEKNRNFIRLVVKL